MNRLGRSTIELVPESQRPIGVGIPVVTRRRTQPIESVSNGRNHMMMRSGRTGLARLVMVLVFLLGIGHSARACPNCKEAVSLQEGEQINLSNGYNWSV